MTADGGGLGAGARPVWRGSSRSGAENGDCVEMAVGVPGAVPVRDSKNAAVAPLVFTPGAWRAFVRSLREEGAG
ncbi:DUF397 domain-containing protein [Streptomyces avicenniae]|uniref:DUF397 domain-containing protein n=1 Tax=Streptomyces avicenniae TaxID=500153 RepID=UPI00069B19BB|nr:DUF397 domain-containing protein [Streptomyces avicenniae]